MKQLRQLLPNYRLHHVEANAKNKKKKEQECTRKFNISNFLFTLYASFIDFFFQKLKNISY